MQSQKTLRKLLSLLLALTLLGGLLVPPVSAEAVITPKPLESAPAPEDAPGQGGSLSPAGREELVRVSIVLDQASALEQGYSPESLSRNSAAAAYRQSLRSAQDQVQTRIEAAIGSKLEVKWHLTLAANLISAVVRRGDLERIRSVPGVKRVFLENRYEAPGETGEEAEPNTANSSSAMVGAAQTWAEGYTGAGSRIAVIDTGLDLSHQSVNAEAFSYAISQTGKTVSPRLYLALGIS